MYPVGGMAKNVASAVLTAHLRSCVGGTAEASVKLYGDKLLQSFDCAFSTRFGLWSLTTLACCWRHLEHWPLMVSHKVCTLFNKNKL